MGNIPAQQDPQEPHAGHLNQNLWEWSPGVDSFKTPLGVQMCIWVRGGEVGAAI